MCLFLYYVDREREREREDKKDIRKAREYKR